MRFIATLLIGLACSTAHATAMQEVNYWRARNGLPAFVEVPWITASAQAKAEYRAARCLKDGHDGPKHPAGCREGTGEATSMWGWLTCCMEETGKYAGAGVSIGADGERYMVLMVWGEHGRAPIGRRVRPLRTAHLTPDAPVIKRVKRSVKSARVKPRKITRRRWRW